MSGHGLQYIVDWTIHDLLTQFGHAARSRGIVVSYAHCETMYLIATQDRARSIFQRIDRVYIDGVGAQLAMFILDGHWRRRLTAEDFIEQLCLRSAAQDTRVAFIGGETGRAEDGRRMIASGASEAVVLCLDGYGDVTDLEVLCTRLRDAKVGLVVLGVGQPLQETLALAIRDRCHGVSVLCVGALFTQLRENPPIARRLRGFGLEWTVRLCRSPRRLAARYLIHPWRTGAWVLALRLGTPGTPS